MRLFVGFWFTVCLLSSGVAAGDWHQWRGADRNGVSADNPPLREQLPPGGLEPLWLAEASVPAVRGGGWSSPVVVAGKVYVFSHTKERRGQAALPPRQYPGLTPEQRAAMSDEEHAEYQQLQREEVQARGRYFRYEEVVYCLDAESGQLLWENRHPSVHTRFAQSGTPAVVDGRLYLLGAGRRARCLDAASGQNLWETQLPGEFRDEFLQSSVAVVDGVAVFVCDWLFGLSADSGSIVWQGDPEETRSTHTSPAVWQSPLGPLLLLNVADGHTICVEPRRGKLLWRVRSEAGNATPVVVGEKMITYGNSRKGGLRCFAISPSGGELLWTFQRSSDPGSSPVVVDGYVYVQGDRRLACLDLETGRTAWSTLLDLAQPRYTSLIAGGGQVIYAMEGLLSFAATAERFEPLIDGKIDDTGLLAAEAQFRQLLDIDRLEQTAEGQKQAEQIWRRKFNSSGPLPCASPALVDGRLYLRLKGGLACYDMRQ